MKTATSRVLATVHHLQPPCPAWCTNHVEIIDADGSAFLTHNTTPIDITVGADGCEDRVRCYLTRSDTPGVVDPSPVVFIPTFNVPIDAASCRLLASVLLHLADEVDR